MHSLNVLARLALLVVGLAAGVRAECAEHADVSMLETFFPPEMLFDESGFLEADRLTLVLEVSTWYNRNLTQLSFADAATDDASLVPVSAASQWFIQEEDDCWITYVIDVAWADMWSNDYGGLTRDDQSDPEFIVFEGTLKVFTEGVQASDIYEGVEVPRTSDESIPFLVRFQKTVSVFAEIDVFSAWALEGIVTSQLIDAKTDAENGEALAEIDVGITTYLQYPFKLDVGSVVVTTDVLELETDLAVTLSQDCSDLGKEDSELYGVRCIQLWDIEIFPRVCELDGTFTLDFPHGVICQPSAVDDCPLDASTDSATLTIVLDSAPFCSQIVDDIGLSAEMATYEEAAFTTPKDDFLVDQRIFFRAVANSTKATIVATEIVGITTEQPLSLVLHDAEFLAPLGPITEDGTTADIQIITDSVPANEGHFSMLIDPTLFPVDALSSAPARILAVLAVTFADTDEVLLLKARALPMPGAKGVALLDTDSTQDVGVQGEVLFGASSVETDGTEGLEGVDNGDITLSQDTIVFVLIGLAILLLVGVFYCIMKSFQSDPKALHAAPRQAVQTMPTPQNVVRAHQPAMAHNPVMSHAVQNRTALTPTVVTDGAELF